MDKDLSVPVFDATQDKKSITRNVTELREAENLIIEFIVEN